MGLESLENRQMLSVTLTGQFLAGQQSGFTVSSTDLINGKAPWTGDLMDYVPANEGGPINLLNDGSMSADKTNLNEASKAPDPAATPPFPGNCVFNADATYQVAYSLVNGDPNTYTGTGYTINEIDVYSGHGDNRTNQYFDISVLVRDQLGFTSWVSLSPLSAGFKYAPNLGGGAAKSVLKSNAGALAANALAIRFTSMGSSIAGAPGQATVWRELDVMGVPTAKPTAPTITGQGGPDKARISWAPIAQADSYDVYKSTTNGTNDWDWWVQASGVTNPYWVDDSAWRPGPYYYKVVAKNGLGSSPFSNTVTVTPSTAAAPAPKNIVAKAGIGKVTLTWDLEGFAEGYNIYRSTSQGGAYTLLTPSPLMDVTYVDSGLNDNTTYWYKISSYNSQTIPTEGSQSAAVSGKTAAMGTGTGLVVQWWTNDAPYNQAAGAPYLDSTGILPTAVSIDQNVENNWGDPGGPAAIAPVVNNFAGRWIGQFQAPITADYIFHTHSDDGIRMWLDGNLISDNWVLRGDTQDSSAPITLNAGQKYDVKIEFFEEGGGANAGVRWETTDGSIPISQIPMSQWYHPAPDKPTVTKLEGNNGVVLSWNPNYATSYTIKRGTSPDPSKMIEVATDYTKFSYFDQPLANDATYYYIITGKNDIGSTDSDAIAVTPKAVAPGAPGAPSVNKAGGGMLKLTWGSTYFADSYNVYRSSTAGGPYTKVNTDPITATTFTDTGLDPATAYYYVVSAANVNGEGPQGPEGTGTTSNLPTGWTEADVGNPGQAGSADYDSATGTFTVRGGGSDIWDGGDHFHFLYVPLHGDGQITARIASFDNPAQAGAVDGWSKVGVMIRRAATDLNSSYIIAGTTWSNNATVQGRVQDDGHGMFDQTGNYSFTAGIRSPLWARITRVGNTIWSELSIDGVQWQMRAPARVMGSWGTDVYIGLAVTAHNDGQLTEAKYDNVTVTTFQTAPVFTLRSTSAAGAVSFGWPNSPSFKTITVERSTDPGFAAGTVTTFNIDPTASNRLNDTVDPNGTYYYRAKAANDKGVESDWSGIIAVTPATGTSRVIGQGASARQWNNTTWSGAPRTVSLAPQVAYDWGDGGAGSLNNMTYRGTIATSTDTFTTYFTGQITPPETGTYTFMSRTDDDGWLWVNGQLVSQDPGGHGVQDPAAANIVPITLTAGVPVDFIFKQRDTGGGSGALMYWYKPSSPNWRETVPNSVLTSAMSAPAAPSGLSATSTGYGGVVGLSFTDNAWNETNFEIQRSTDPSFTHFISGTFAGNQAASPGGTIATGDGVILPGATYYYRVRATNYDAESAWSEAIQVDVPTDISITGSGIAGHYFGTSNGNEPLIGWGPNFAQLDQAIDFTSGSTPAWAPFPNQGNANFTVVWTGKILIDADGRYTFRTRSDDASYVWIDGVVATQWPGGHGEGGGPTGNGVGDGGIDLTAGWHNLVYAMANGGGGYGAHLDWIVPGSDPANPAVVPNDHLAAQSDVPAAAALSFIGLTTTRVTINMTDKAVNDINNILQVSTDANFAPDKTDTVNLAGVNGTGTKTSYQYTKLQKSTHYWVRLMSQNYDGATASNVVDFITPDKDVVPDAPTNLVGEARSNNRNYLKWTDNAQNEDLYYVERASSDQGPWTRVATLPLDSTEYIDGDKNLAVDTTYYYHIIAWNGVGNSAPSNVVALKTVANTMPAEWQNTDIGLNVGTDPLVGSSDFSAMNNAYVIAGGGNDIWNHNDAFHYTWQKLEGDGSITIRVLGIDYTDAWAKAGVMIRQDLTPNSVHAMFIEAAQGLVSFQGRQAELGASWNVDQGGIGAPVYLRMVRTNNDVTSFYSLNGTDFTQVGGAQTLPLEGPAYIGIAVTSHNAGAVAEATIDNVTVTKADLNTKEAQPTNLTAMGGEAGAVVLDWTDNATSETGYRITRSTSATGTFTKVADIPANANHFVDVPGGSSTYYYQVIALNNRGTGLDSAPSTNASSTPGTWPLAANFPTTMANADSMFLWNNNTAFVDNDAGKHVLRLTTAQNSQLGSAYLSDPRDITRFSAKFDLQWNSGAVADGMAFVIQNSGLNAIGAGGGALGYGVSDDGAVAGIPTSVAIKFDIYNALSTVGLYLNGESVGENQSAINVRPAGIVFQSGNVMDTTVSYDGDILTLIMKDETTGAIFRHDWNINIPWYVGNKTAYVGFTAATGGSNAQQDVLNFVYSNNYITPPQDVVVTGTDNADTFYLKHDGASLKVWKNATGTGTPDQTIAWDNIQSITVNGLGGDDKVFLDTGGGTLQPYGGLFINGGAGANVVGLRGLPATADLTVGNKLIHWDSQDYNYTDASVQLGAASVGTTPSAVVLKSLTLTDGARVGMTSANALGAWGKHQVLDLKALSIADTAQLDLADNDMILRHTDGDFGIAKTKQVTSTINKAFSTGADAWLGNGLTSSAAYNDYNVGDMVTNLAVFNNDDGTGFAWYDTFDGQAVDNYAVLVKYTMYGDTDLDGVITGSDFAAATVGWFDYKANKPVTYMTGDFNYDGASTADDFALITSSWFVSTRADHAGKPMAAEDAPTAVFDAPIVASAPAANVAMATTSPFATTTQKSDKVFLTDDIAVLA